MFGTGLPEIVIILLVVLLLFGPAVLTFWLGYVVGQNRAADTGPAREADSEHATDDGPKEGTDE
jgi:Sec-independent protein translocase protein TatA